MKFNYSILTVLTVAIALLASCKEEPYIQGPGDNSHNQDSIYTPPTDADPEGVDIPEDALTVSEIVKIGKAMQSGEVSEQVYHIKGWIVRLGDKNADGIASYGNATFYMADGRAGGAAEFEAFQVLGKDKQKLMNVEQVQVGDFVVIEGKITNYNGNTIETEGKGAAFIYSSSNPLFSPKDPDPTPDPAGANVPEGTLNVYEACALCNTLASGTNTPDKYYVKGFVTRLDSKHESGISSFGNGTFYIAANADGMVTKEFEAYQVYGKDGQKLTSADQVQVGDFVVIYGQLTNYNGTSETVGKGAAYIYYSNNPAW